MPKLYINFEEILSCAHGNFEDQYKVFKFAGLNPAEAVGFFRAKKSSARLPSEGK
jgi:hypothetical protein